MLQDDEPPSIGSIPSVPEKPAYRAENYTEKPMIHTYANGSAPEGVYIPGNEQEQAPTQTYSPQEEEEEGEYKQIYSPFSSPNAQQHQQPRTPGIKKGIDRGVEEIIRIWDTITQKTGLKTKKTKKSKKTKKIKGRGKKKSE